MIMARTEVEIVGGLRNGALAQVCNDPGAVHEDGRRIEGTWYISCGGISYCYYPTRAVAREIIQAAREMMDTDGSGEAV